MEIKQMETKALIPLVGSKVCLEGGGGIRHFVPKLQILNLFKFNWSLGTSLTFTTYSKQACKEYEKRKVKHATCKNVKGRVWRFQTQLGDTVIFEPWFR